MSKINDRLNEFNLPDSSSKELDEISKLVNDTKRIELNADYKQSVITKFRNNLESKSSSKTIFNYKYVFASLVIIASGYFISTQLFFNDNLNIEKILVDLSNEEVNLIVDNYGLSNKPEENINEVNAQTIDALYSQNLSETVNNIITDESNTTFVNSYMLTDVENLLTDDEVDILYSQLIEKEIL